MREKPNRPNLAFAQQGRITGGPAGAGCGNATWCLSGNYQPCLTFAIPLLLLPPHHPGCPPRRLASAGIQQVNDSQLLTTAGDGRLMVWDLRNAGAGPVKFAVPDARWGRGGRV